MKEEGNPAMEDEDNELQLICKASKCFRNMNGACLLADILHGEGKVNIGEDGKCTDYYE